MKVLYRPSMMLVCAAAAGLLCSDCSSSSGSKTGDAGASTDTVSQDGQNHDGQNHDGQNHDGQNHDGQDHDGPALDQAVAGFPMPIYRVGPRISFGGGFSKAFTGSLKLPKTSKGFTSFDGWQIRGHGLGGGSMTIDPTVEQGEQLVAAFSGTISFVFEKPIEGREVFTAISGDESIVLLGVLSADGTLHLDVGSTARQAISLAALREEPGIPQEETYYSGIAEGDDAVLDGKVSGVAAAMTQQLEQEGNTGVTAAGGLLPATPVFSAVDQALSDATLSAPQLSPPGSPSHLGVLQTGGVAGSIGFWAEGGGMPTPPIQVPAGADSVGFFFYSIPIDASTQFFARMRAPDGRQSPATALAKIASASSGTPPGAPTLEVDETQKLLRACDADPGNRVVLFSSGTEFAVGFAAVEVGTSGCIEYPQAQVPQEAMGMVFAIQVDQALMLSAPSSIAIF